MLIAKDKKTISACVCVINDRNVGNPHSYRLSTLRLRACVCVFVCALVRIRRRTLPVYLFHFFFLFQQKKNPINDRKKNFTEREKKHWVTSLQWSLTFTKLGSIVKRKNERMVQFWKLINLRAFFGWCQRGQGGYPAVFVR